MKVFFLGSWYEPGRSPGGHHLYAAASVSPMPRAQRVALEYYADGQVHIDGSLAPRKMADGRIIWAGNASAWSARQTLASQSGECDQGQFLRHELDTGYTAISWWDRCQGDHRGGSNSTILVEGRRTTEEMLAALKEHFPHLLTNLERHGVQLVEVFPSW